MTDALYHKAFRALLGLSLLLSWLAGSLPANATLPSWQEVSAVNWEGLVAAARQHLSAQEIKFLEQAMNKETPNYRPHHTENVSPPLMQLKYGGFIGDLLTMVRTCLARGDSAKVQQFFQVVNQEKLIRGYGRFFQQRGGYGGPMVIQLALRQSPQKDFQVEVSYR